MLNFGPLYIPRKGDTLPIDTMNIELYRKMMTYFTGQDISVKSGQMKKPKVMSPAVKEMREVVLRIQ